MSKQIWRYTVGRLICPKCRKRYFQFGKKLKNGKIKLHCWDNGCKHVWTRTRGVSLDGDRNLGSSLKEFRKGQEE